MISNAAVHRCLKHRLTVVCPPGGAGELRLDALQENSARVRRRRGESRHGRDDRQQAADSNPPRDEQGHGGE